jgi:hypothetical protein
MNKYTVVCLLLAFLFACKKDKNEPPVTVSDLQLMKIRVGTYNLDLSNAANNKEASANEPVLISFSAALDTTTVRMALTLKKGTENIPLTFAYLDNNATISAKPAQALANNTEYQLAISNSLKGATREAFPGIQTSFTTKKGELSIVSYKINNQLITGTSRITNVPQQVSIELKFSTALDPQTVTGENLRIVSSRGTLADLSLTLSSDKTTVTLTSNQPLEHFNKHTFYALSALRGAGQETFNLYSRDFYTAVDPTPKFPLLSDEDLLTLIQKQTFKYFWDFAHPVSGLARERDTSGDIITTGGSGFGLMALIVGMERNFISRADGIARLEKIVAFLEKADRFHGAWPHWMDGNSGKVVPFSPNDDGGDLVETSFLVQGLLAVRQYLDKGNAAESQLAQKITALWEGVEWDWYTQGGKDVLYWHWSPRVGWAMNFELHGYNEALITYVLAASSPTHSIGASVYQNGWAKGSNFMNGKTFYGIKLPLGFDFGGPLFFTHYSFLGLDPRKLSDSYANYWEQNTHHTLINREHAIRNPQNFVGYGAQAWGLTASDNQDGYNAHSPTNDLGVISPTAAVSSMPYAPDYSMEALKFFYYTVGDKTWGPYGFYDAFNVTKGWFGKSYLAIDQGPMIDMIENQRTALLWNLFMSAPEVKAGLNKLSFTY